MLLAAITSRRFMFFCLLNVLVYTIAFADPPPQPAISPAEFEPMTGVLIRYPTLPLILIAEMAEDVEVKSIVASESQLQTAYNQYNNYGVNMNNCTWLIAPTNSYVVRDYGPWFIFTGDDVQGIVDHIYNRPTRPDDNRIPMVLGDSLGIPVYALPLIHTGGNYMSDGMGVGMSTTLVLSENGGLTPERVDTIMHGYLGLDVHHKFEDPDPMNIQHIDCWAKLLDPGKILIKRLHPLDQLLEANAEYIASLMSSYGRPYEVIRIDCDASTAYTNSLILNNKVLVPILNHPLDRQALQTYQEAMPGYEVIGFTGCGSGYNALHCRTMGITDRYMLRIIHIPLHDRENTGGDYLVEALVHPYSNMPLLPASPELRWKTEAGHYTSVTMTHAVGDTYTARIPEQPDGTDIFYYIHAEDDSGRVENLPYIGSGNPHHFYVGADNEPPTIETEIPETLLPFSLPLSITAVVRDNLWISSVSLEYMINNTPVDTIEMELQPLSAALYETEIDPPVSPGDQIQLRIRAVDNSINQNISYSPEIGYYNIDIIGDSRVCVWNPCGLSSGSTIFNFLQQGGIQSYYTEEEPVSFNRFSSMFICLGSWPGVYMLNLDQVNTITDYIESGHCVYLEGTDAWAYGPYHVQLSQAFGIVGLWDGPYTQSVTPISGVPGTFTESMSFNSYNDNYVDRIAPAAGSEVIFVHADTAYGVTQETPEYKTVGISVEFGSLSGNNPSSSQQILLGQILRYFRSIPAEISGSALEASLSLIPEQYTLYQNYPNPFNHTTTIRFGLPVASLVDLEIFDIHGRRVGVACPFGGLAPTRQYPPGHHQFTFDGSNLPSGIYIYRLTAGNFTASTKMALLK